MMLKYISVFINHEPIDTIDALRNEFKNLPLERLLPAFAGINHSCKQIHMVTNYLGDFIENSEVSLVHNLYIYLLASADNNVFNDMLLQHLDSQEASYKRRMPIYMCKTFALRQCQRYEKKEALMRIYSMLDYNEKSVMLALELKDFKTAEAYANYAALVENDKQILRNLWMNILKTKSLEKEADIRDLLDILKASKGYLTISDVLQCSSSHIKLREFENSLRDQFIKLDNEIEKARKDIKTFVGMTEKRYKEILNLDKTAIHIDGSALCNICNERLITWNKLIVFPCKHSFHRNCVYEWLLKGSEEKKKASSDKNEKRGSIPIFNESLHSKLSRAIKNDSEIESKILQKIALSSCPLCDEFAIDLIDVDFEENFDMALNIKK